MTVSGNPGYVSTVKGNKTGKQVKFWKVLRVITNRDHGGLNCMCENGFEEELTDLRDMTDLKFGGEEGEGAGVTGNTLLAPAHELGAVTKRRHKQGRPD